jgi:hypothetical protein
MYCQCFPEKSCEAQESQQLRLVSEQSIAAIPETIIAARFRGLGDTVMPFFTS